MSYRIDHIPRNTPNNRRPGLAMNATTITIHNTGNPSSTARNERNWLTNPSNSATASYHIVIDEREAIECIPLNEVAWHAGDGSAAGSGNRTSIGIEICESGNYARTLERAVDLVAGMLKERGWGVDRLRRHYDWSSKNCPRLMNLDKKWTGWHEFVARVAAALNPPAIPTSEEESRLFKELQTEVESLKRALTAATERVEAPAWFVSEFGSGDLGGLLSEPAMTKEGWRIVALSLRAQGFGNGRGVPVDIK